MMIKVSPTIVLLLLAGGCMTAAGGGGGGDSAYATYRMVQDLGSAVDNLNQTTAAMSVRLDQSDRTLRELKSLSEENQVKLNQIQSSLDQLTATIYEQFGLTPPRSATGSRAPVYIAPEPQTIESGEIIVQPPPSSMQSVPQSSLPPRTTSSMGIDEHYNDAQQLYGAGNFEGALLKFAEHLRMYPQSPHASNAQYWKAHCHFKLGNYDSAIEEFERLRSSYPSSNKVPTAMHNEAVAYSRVGQSARAEALFRRLVVEYPNDAAADSAREKLRQIQGLE